MLAPIALFVVVAAYRGRPEFRLLVGEDGILEWAQVGAYAIAAWALIAASVSESGRRRLALAGCGVGVLGIIGEELAWGTRLIGSGIEPIESRNEQGDTTIHNLTGVLDVSFLGLAAVSALLAASLLMQWSPLREASLTLVWWLLLPALYASYRVVADDVPYHVAKLSEVAEFVFALAVARLSLCFRPVHRYRQPREPNDSTSHEVSSQP